jgi:hypothetical protein
LLLLARLVDDEGGTLCFLLGDLLGFDSCGELGGEGEVLGKLADCGVGGIELAYRQRNIIQHDVEPRRSPDQVVPYEPGYVLTLCDELRSIELCDHALQHFVDNRRQHALVVVGSQCAVYLGQGIDSGSRQNTAGDVDHLQVLGAGERGDISRFRAHVVGDGCLEPGNAEMGAFSIDLLLHAAYSGVLDGAVATVHCGAVSCANRAGGNAGPSIAQGRMQNAECRMHEPLNSALFAMKMPPPMMTRPAMPPNVPFGGRPPPAPPNRAVRRVSSVWSRRQASWGSGADIAGGRSL